MSVLISQERWRFSMNQLARIMILIALLSSCNISKKKEGQSENTIEDKPSRETPKRNDGLFESIVASESLDWKTTDTINLNIECYDVTSKCKEGTRIQVYRSYVDINDQRLLDSGNVRNGKYVTTIGVPKYSEVILVTANYENKEGQVKIIDFSSINRVVLVME